jgi:hypothetical protein
MQSSMYEIKNPALFVSEASGESLDPSKAKMVKTVPP